MGDVFRFRRLQHGSPRRFSIPYLLPRRAPRTARRARLLGLLALVVFLAPGWIYAERRNGSAPAGATHMLGSDRTPDAAARGAVRSPNRIHVRAIDGDSLRYGHEEVRLLGIDAPEYRQTYRDERGRPWPCGREARAELERLIGRGAVDCRSSGRDRYGRALAICSAARIGDVGEAIVRAGYAVDYMGGRYTAAEAEARAARRGIWRGEFERPDAWRRANPRTPRYG